MLRYGSFKKPKKRRYLFSPFQILGAIYPVLYLVLRKSIHLEVFDERSGWCVDDPKVIDIFLLWVNGSSTEWIQRRNKTALLYNITLTEHFLSARYDDHDEMKWALRSIEKYAPWINKIHILTDKQYPYWMKRDHPKVHWVDHDTLFYPGFHTYNSIAMQFAANRIPGVSRRLILMDDDYLFLNHVTSEDFYDNENRTLIHGWFGSQPYNYSLDINTIKKCSNSHTGSIFNVGTIKAHRVAYILFRSTAPLYFSHVQFPLDILVLNELTSRVNIAKTMFTPFRVCGDLQMQNMYLAYSYAINRSLVLTNQESFAILREESFQTFYSLKPSPKLACINLYNETFYKQYLPLIFPNKSSFEL